MRFFAFLLLCLPPLFAQPRSLGLSDEQVEDLLPEGVSFLPNLSYREGHDRWRLDLFLPKNEETLLRPALVVIHGGGFVNGDKRRGGFLRVAIDYASKGYVTMPVNYRLRQANEVAPILDSVADVKNAVRWLRAHAEEYQVDPNRIGAIGGSAGAHLAVMLAVCATEAGLEGDGPYQEYSSQVQAAAASATPTDLANFDNPRQIDPNTDRELLIKASPITYVSADSPPLLLFHELSDRTVKVDESDRLVDALRKLKTSTTSCWAMVLGMVYLGGTHLF